ncbi:P-loop containing nucleoside triphosphate hydrolase protein [Dendrothele bispora CBS 962.96]|uniref:P-loop containing nucleoside triphosphate hydrolase protein n=1 Tax=Dendrothele bispora (strain CBS 962.96) TaxID=1314807 RepID=A0A4S8MZ37_DENBC|nr:P-loop containing nucleoside triphosphate hydrolase protein [Dendrothele bispora CBS 962.96]
MALVAHIDSGKTTLTESILFRSSYLSTSGSVDTGSTTTDFLPAERERGITIQSASIPVKWKQWTFNLIDTPGHADFGMEVESASRVVDGAVVLMDSVEGVEAQTKGVWGQLDRYGVSTRMIFLNKLDRPGASFGTSLRSLLVHRLHPHPLVLTLPISSFDPKDYSHAEPGIQGLVDLVKWEVWKWDDSGKAKRHPLPTDIDELRQLSFIPSDHPIIPHLPTARNQLLDNLSMFSEGLMESLLSLPADPSAYLGVKAEDILPVLRRSTLENHILPVLCGSAIKNVGTDLVMDYVGELFASPVDRSSDRERNSTLRIVVVNATRNQKERVSKLLLLYASEAVEVDELPFGSVGVILGLKYTRTGDTLVSNAEQSTGSQMRDIIPPPAVISASVVPQSHSDLAPVQEALESLSRTDPSVRVDVQDGQILLHGLGALHLEIVEGRLRDEWKAQFELGKRRVSYREALDVNLSDVNDHSVEIAGTSVTVELRLRPLRDDEEGNSLWDGNVVVNKAGEQIATPESSNASPEAYIASGVASALSSSPHSSLPMSRVHVEIVNYSSPQPLSMLTGASALIMRKHLRSAGLGSIMEPYFLFKVAVPADSMGKVVKDLTEHGAELQDLGDAGMTDELGGYPEDGVYIPPGWLSPSASSLTDSGSPRLKRSIHALAPLSRMLDYNSRLRALSGGHGQFEMTNAGFRVVSEPRKLEIMREIGRA